MKRNLGLILKTKWFSTLKGFRRMSKMEYGNPFIATHCNEWATVIYNYNDLLCVVVIGILERGGESSGCFLWNVYNLYDFVTDVSVSFKQFLTLTLPDNLLTIKSIWRLTLIRLRVFKLLLKSWQFIIWVKGKVKSKHQLGLLRTELNFLRWPHQLVII